MLVPWIPQQPPRPPAHPPLARACTPPDLSARLFLQGATGSLVGGVELTNVGRAPCALVGRSRVALVARGERWRVVPEKASPAPPEALGDPPGSLRALRPGKSAVVSLFWSNWCGTRPPAAIVLGLSAGSVRVPVADAPRCDAPAAPSTISVAPFTPSLRQLPASSRLPLHAEIATSALHVRRGAVLRYVVALTNTGARSFRFRSCPVYVQQLAPSVPARAYVLNCRPVARIAPGATVLFEMRIAVPATARAGPEGLSWELAPTTYLAPVADAPVRVTR